MKLLRIFDKFGCFVENGLLTTAQTFHVREIARLVGRLPGELIVGRGGRQRVAWRRPVDGARRSPRREINRLAQKGHVEQMRMTGHRVSHADVREILCARAEKQFRAFLHRTHRMLKGGVERRIDVAAGVLERELLRFQLIDFHVELAFRVFQPFAVDGQTLPGQFGHVFFVLVHFHLDTFAVDRRCVERQRTKQCV